MPCDAHARAREREGCTYTGRSNRIGGLNVTDPSRVPLICVETLCGRRSRARAWSERVHETVSRRARRLDLRAFLGVSRSINGLSFALMGLLACRSFARSFSRSRSPPQGANQSRLLFLPSFLSFVRPVNVILFILASSVTRPSSPPSSSSALLTSSSLVSRPFELCDVDAPRDDTPPSFTHLVNFPLRILILDGVKTMF